MTPSFAPFDFPYFANSRILAVEADSLHGVWAGEETFTLGQRGGLDGTKTVGV